MSKCSEVQWSKGDAVQWCMGLHCNGCGGVKRNALNSEIHSIATFIFK